MMPKAKGQRAMGFGEYLGMLGLSEDAAPEPDVTAEDALKIAERIRAADRKRRR